MQEKINKKMQTISMRKKKEKTTPVKHIPVSLELLTYCSFQKQMPKIQVSDTCLVAHTQVSPPDYNQDRKLLSVPFCSHPARALH